ncbi:hypothetical protein JTE90_001828 [Oedothorax gibbosus]|uniref:Uncharacterized protein n=1 Tax=Oedothorax gibbosus TaxID=931172 RepID=A0AAV6U344_9ARAC|nr:hypothetical protein JTE90_001828 [Oedothorax gibbosus]
MLKPYYKRPEEVNYLISDLEGENDEEQMEIPCVDSNPNILDLEEMFQDYGESSNMNEDQIAQMKKLVWKYMKCFSMSQEKPNSSFMTLNLAKNSPSFQSLIEHRQDKMQF